MANSLDRQNGNVESGNFVTTEAGNIYGISPFGAKSYRSRQTATNHDKPRPNDDIGDINDKAC
jgi:hypothetical protein